MKDLKAIQERKIELRSLLNDENCDIDAIEKELNELEKRQSEIEKRFAIAQKLNDGKIIGVEKKMEKEERTFGVDSVEYRNAFLKNLQGKELDELEKRAMTTSNAGAVIPTMTMNKIVEKLENEGVILPLVTMLNIPSNVTIPVESTTNAVSWVAEGTGADQTDTITSLNLKAHELIKTIDITAHVEEMAIDAFETFIVNALARKTKVAIDNAIINGTGSTNNMPKGVLTEFSTGSIETGATTGYEYDDILDLIKSVKSGYRQNAVFVMSTNTLYGQIAKVKDTVKQPIFKIEVDNRFEGRLCGYPVICYDNAPDNTIIFGDFEYYYFNFAKSFEVAKDTSVGFKTAKTCYRALALADGGVALKEAFGVMKLKTANAG